MDLTKKRGVIDNFRSITLTNTEMKIVDNMLSKRLVRVADDLVGEAQTCVVSGRTIQDNLHLIRYTAEGLNEPDKRGAAVHLDKSNAFGRVVRVPAVRVNGFLSKPLPKSGATSRDNQVMESYLNHMRMTSQST